MFTQLWNQFLNLLSTKGSLSMVRFLSLICVATASVLALLGLCDTHHTLESVAVLCGTFLGAGLGAKVAQKHMELRAPSEDQAVNFSAPLNKSSAFQSSTLKDNIVQSGENEDEK